MLVRVSRPRYGKTTGERSSRVRDAHSFELWTSLFADDCVLLFQSRDDLIRGSNHIVAHLWKFGGHSFRKPQLFLNKKNFGMTYEVTSMAMEYQFRNSGSRVLLSLSDYRTSRSICSGHWKWGGADS